MGQWVETGDHFIEADVLRWKEAVFQTRRRNGKSVKIGERLVVAEVLREDSDWVYLLVRHCELASTMTGRLPRQVPLLGIGQATKRKRRTISRAKPERLLWSDENVRSVIASKFLGRRAEANE